MNIFGPKRLGFLLYGERVERKTNRIYSNVKNVLNSVLVGSTFPII
jgi:hypothetical protein